MLWKKRGILNLAIQLTFSVEMCGLEAFLDIFLVKINREKS